MKFKFSRKSLLVSALALALLITLLAFFVDWDAVIKQLSQANVYYLIFASVSLIVGYLCYAIRWRLLLANKSRLRPTFHAANFANMANTLLPLRPGDAARILILGGEDDLSVLEVTSSIVVERWFEQIMRLAAFGGAVIFGAGGAVSSGTILGSVAFLIAAFLFMLWLIKQRSYVLDRFPRWLARLPRIKEEQARQGLISLIDGLTGIASARHLATTLMWSVITWGLFWGFHYLCLSALGQEIDLNVRLALSLGSLALVPPSATTLPGVYQISMVVPLGLIGYDENLLISYALIMNTIEMVWVVGLGMWGSLHSGITLQQLKRSSASATPGD